MKVFSLSSYVLQFILLMVFWMILSGHFDVIHLSMGAVCVALVLFFHAKLFRYAFFKDDEDAFGALRLGQVLPYVVWLLWQIVQSGIQVTKIVLGNRSRVQTYIVRFRANLPNVQAQVILGNSITLTPGTLTLEIDGDLFTVHALSPDSYEGILNDEMPKRVLRLFQREERPVISEVSIMGKESV